MNISPLMRRFIGLLTGISIAFGVVPTAGALQLSIPDKVRQVRGEDGRQVTVSKLNERLRPVIPLAGNTMGHEAFFDLTGRVRLSPEGPQVLSSVLQVGYQVGCSVAIDNLTIGGGHDVTLSPTVGESTTTSVGGSAGGNGSVTPSTSVTPSIGVSPSIRIGTQPEVALGGNASLSNTTGVSTTVGGHLDGNAQQSVTQYASLGVTTGIHHSWSATLKPGGVTTVIFGELPFTGYAYSGIGMTNMEMNIDSCIGFVSVRSFVRIIYRTAVSLNNITVYGKPRYF